MMPNIMPNRSTGLRFKLDTDRILTGQNPESMKLLEQWHRDGVIDIVRPGPMIKEAFSGEVKTHTRKTTEYIWTDYFAETADEKSRLMRLVRIMFPATAKYKHQEVNAEVVFTAVNISARRPSGGLPVIHVADAIKMVRHALITRDEQARYIADRERSAVPEWVGKD